MNFSYKDDQLAFQSSVKKYLSDNYDFESRQKIVHAADSFSHDIWQQQAELGWMYLLFSEEVGGFGGSAVDTMMLFEELGRHLSVEPFMQTVLLGGKLLQASNLDTRGELINQLMEGSLQLALAHYEGAHREGLNNIAATATQEADKYSIDGCKSLVYNADSADYLLVSANIDNNSANEKASLAVFLLPANSDGLQLKTYTTSDGRVAAEVEMQDVQVPEQALLFSGEQAQTNLAAVLDEATLAAVAEVVGGMEVLVDTTVEYSKDRKQFGVAIGKFQALQHMMADMCMAKELARSLMYAAAIKLRDASADASAFVAAAKVQADQSAKLVGHYAVQIHGGIATTDELKVGHYLKRSVVNSKLFGSTEYHVQRYIQLSEK